MLFTAYAGTDVKYDGEEYLIMREDDILGVINRCRPSGRFHTEKREIHEMTAKQISYDSEAREHIRNGVQAASRAPSRSRWARAGAT